MSGLSRTKGKAGARAIANLVRDITGWDVRRRVRQHDGLGYRRAFQMLENAQAAEAADEQRGPAFRIPSP